MLKKIFLAALIVFSAQTANSEEIKYSLIAVNTGEKGIYLNWEWDGQDKAEIMRRGASGFKTIVVLNDDRTFFFDTLANYGIKYDYYVIYQKHGRKSGRTNSVFNVVRTEEQNPLPTIAEFIRPDKSIINPAFGIYKKNRPLFVWRDGLFNAKFDGFINKNENIFSIFNEYHDIGETGNVLVPAVLWDFNADGRDELILRTGSDTDSTFLSIFTIGDTLKFENKIYLPRAPDFPKGNELHYLAPAYLDGYDAQPSLLVQIGLHYRAYLMAYDITPDFKITQRWSYTTDGPTKGGGSHGIYGVDVDGDGKDEALYGTICMEEGQVKWFAGQGGRPDGKDGWVVGHGNFVSFGDVIPENEGIEIFYCVEGRDKVKGLSGSHLVDGDTGELIWSNPYFTSIGFLANITDEYDGLECGAWSGEGGFWYIYNSEGTMIYSEKCPSSTYMHPLKWTNPAIAEIIIRKKGGGQDLGRFVDSEEGFEVIILPRNGAEERVNTLRPLVPDKVNEVKETSASPMMFF